MRVETTISTYNYKDGGVYKPSIKISSTNNCETVSLSTDLLANKSSLFGEIGEFHAKELIIAVQNAINKT